MKRYVKIKSPIIKTFILVCTFIIGSSHELFSMKKSGKPAAAAPAQEAEAKDLSTITKEFTKLVDQSHKDTVTKLQRAVSFEDTGIVMAQVETVFKTIDKKLPNFAALAKNHSQDTAKIQPLNAKLTAYAMALGYEITNNKNNAKGQARSITTKADTQITATFEIIEKVLGKTTFIPLYKKHYETQIVPKAIPDPVAPETKRATPAVQAVKEEDDIIDPELTTLIQQELAPVEALSKQQREELSRSLARSIIRAANAHRTGNQAPAVAPAAAPVMPEAKAAAPVDAPAAYKWEHDFDRLCKKFDYRAAVAQSIDKAREATKAKGQKFEIAPLSAELVAAIIAGDDEKVHEHAHRYHKKNAWTQSGLDIGGMWIAPGLLEALDLAKKQNPQNNLALQYLKNLLVGNASGMSKQQAEQFVAQFTVKPESKTAATAPEPAPTAPVIARTSPAAPKPAVAPAESVMPKAPAPAAAPAAPEEAKKARPAGETKAPAVSPLIQAVRSGNVDTIFTLTEEATLEQLQDALDEALKINQQASINTLMMLIDSKKDAQPAKKAQAPAKKAQAAAADDDDDDDNGDDADDDDNDDEDDAPKAAKSKKAVKAKKKAAPKKAPARKRKADTDDDGDDNENEDDDKEEEAKPKKRTRRS